MQKRIYLASPYTSHEAAIREARYIAACCTAAEIMKKGNLVFSPIAHSHVLTKKHQLPVHFNFWQNWCLSFLRHWATDFYILDIPGWRESKGIEAEKLVAEELELPVYFWTDVME